MFRKSKRGREMSWCMVHSVCRVRMLNSTPARIWNIQKATSSIVSCFPEMQTLTCRGTTLPDLRNLQLPNFSLMQLLSKGKEIEIGSFWNARRIFPCGNESTVRRKWRKNTAGQWHRRGGYYAAAVHVPLYWSLDFSWNPLYTHT